MLAKPILLCNLALTFAVLAVGCLGKRQSEQYVVAYQPPQNAGAEEAYWRKKYEASRITPPEHFSVPPGKPRNNSFGEFEDRLYDDLDRQPRLPDIPDNTYSPGPLPGSGQAVPPPPLPSARSSEAAPARAAAPAARVHTPSPTNLAGPGLGGVDTGAHFYPVEQLVYGGDFPDLDQPESYRLMPRDQITVTVKDHPEFACSAVVQADGTINIINTPDLVRIRGLTTEEAAEAIRRVLTIYVKGDCVVRVQANRASGGYYFVFGDVNQPGRFPMGMEPVKLSEAVLAANWEANPARRDVDGDDLGPSFPAAAPRGRYLAPKSADLARVMLVTPHRSQPVRTIHDVRAALTGMTGDDPLVRAGQVIIVPSIDAKRNSEWGLDVPQALAPGRGFSGPDTPARLPDAAPPAVPARGGDPEPGMDAVEENMAIASHLVGEGETARVWRMNSETDYPDYRDRQGQPVEVSSGRKRNRVAGW